MHIYGLKDIYNVERELEKSNSLSYLNISNKFLVEINLNKIKINIYYINNLSIINI